MTHGTTTAYTYRCRCDDCKRAHREAKRDYNARGGPKTWRGTNVPIDTDTLARALASDGRSLRRFSLDCGLAPGTVGAIVRRGTSCEGVLDTIASHLGVHMSVLEAA